MAFAFEPKADQHLPGPWPQPLLSLPAKLAQFRAPRAAWATALSRRRQKSRLSDSNGNTSVSKSRDVPLFPLPIPALQESPKPGTLLLATPSTATSYAPAAG